MRLLPNYLRLIKPHKETVPTHVVDMVRRHIHTAIGGPPPDAAVRVALSRVSDDLDENTDAESLERNIRAAVRDVLFSAVHFWADHYHDVQADAKRVAMAELLMLVVLAPMVIADPSDWPMLLVVVPLEYLRWALLKGWLD